MAITVISSPENVQPAYNQVNYLISSDNTALPNFNFVCDVYIGGVLISRLLYPKAAGSTQVGFDISTVLRNYVSYDFINVSGLVNSFNSNSVADYYVQLGELIDVSGIPTISSGLTRNPTSGTKRVCNSVFDFLEWSPTIMSDYLLGNGKFLSTQNGTVQVGQEKIITTYFATAPTKLTVTINGVSTDYTLGAIGSTNTFQNFNIGKTLMTIMGLTPSGVVSVAFKNGATTLATYSYTIDDSCSQYDTVRLHWLNKFGGWEAYNFRKVSVASFGVDRSQFKTIMGLNYSKSDRLKINYQTTITDTLNVNSDWINDTEGLWLAGLVQSPIIYQEVNNAFIAVQVTDASYTIPTYLDGRDLKKISLNIQPSYNRYRQSL